MPVRLPRTFRDVAMDAGASKVNVKVAPESPVVKLGEMLTPPVTMADGAKKSVATPVVVPVPSRTVIVQVTPSLTRTLSEPLVSPMQATVEAAVGVPTVTMLTTVRGVVLASSAVMENGTIVLGDVTVNLILAPSMLRAETVRLGLVEGVPKSARTAVITVLDSRGTMVHVTSSLIRTVSVPERVPTQDIVEVASAV